MCCDWSIRNGAGLNGSVYWDTCFSGRLHYILIEPKVKININVFRENLRILPSLFHLLFYQNDYLISVNEILISKHKKKWWQETWRFPCNLQLYINFTLHFWGWTKKSCFIRIRTKFEPPISRCTLLLAVSPFCQYLCLRDASQKPFNLKLQTYINLILHQPCGNFVLF